MRSWWRHQQVSVRMAMATVMHHGPMHTESGAPRGQMTATMARREESHEMNDAICQKTPPSAAFFRVHDEGDAEPGVRPPCLGEPPGPQTRIEKRPASARACGGDVPMVFSSVFRIVEQNKKRMKKRG